MKGLKQRGIAVGKIFFPKSYFQQTASKTCFLELKYYVYLLEKHHNTSPVIKESVHL
jgi:Leu/Phe-tRNA-protein transferase